jgi:hypothetical protein
MHAPEAKVPEAVEMGFGAEDAVVPDTGWYTGRSWGLYPEAFDCVDILSVFKLESGGSRECGMRLSLINHI